nr:LysR substrate-binding domain-containing protein [Achromobacter sp. DH1f]
MEVTRAALSQHLKALQRHLNLRLLTRTTRDMSLTEEGQRLLDVLQPALTSIERAVRELGEANAEPSIRINTSRVAARLLLEPRMDEFLARHPKLRLELIMNDGFSNIGADGLDAGIRLGESLDEHMIAATVTPMLEMAIVGPPAYFARRDSRPRAGPAHRSVRAPAPDAGSLVRVLRPWCRPFPGFFLYVPSRAQMPAKIRAL